MSYKSKTDVRYFDPFEVDWEESNILLPQVPLRGTQRLSIVGRLHRPTGIRKMHITQHRHASRPWRGRTTPTVICLTRPLQRYSYFPYFPIRQRTFGRRAPKVACGAAGHRRLMIVSTTIIAVVRYTFGPTFADTPSGRRMSRWSYYAPR